MKTYPITQFVLVVLAVTVLSLLYFFYPASSNSFYPDCIFHLLTGLFCPGCGSQRAVSALLHGDIYRAMDFNLLMVFSLPFIHYSAFVFTWNIFSGKKRSQNLFYTMGFVKILLAAVIFFSVLRNLPLYPFAWLAP